MTKHSILRTDYNHPHFRSLVKELDSDLHGRYSEEQAEYDQYNSIEAINTVVLLYEDEVPVGCGAFKNLAEKTIEVKRMFVKPSVRGKGYSKIILYEVEKWANELGNDIAILETGKKQLEAIGLYQKAGYRQIANYGQYKNMPNSVCFEKSL